MSPKVPDLTGRLIQVNESDVASPHCSNCQTAQPLRKLRVSHVVDMPPNGRAYFVCAVRCIPG